MLLNAAAILAAKDKTKIVVDVPEWGTGGQVLVGAMGATAYARMQDWLLKLGTEVQPDPDDPADEELRILTCDSPDAGGDLVPGQEGCTQPDRALLEHRVGELERFLRGLAQSLAQPLADAERREIADGIAALLEQSQDRRPRVYTQEEEWLVMVRWCAECILDPESEQPAFTGDQVGALGGKHPEPIRRIFRAAQDVNLVSRSAAKDAEKNSAGTPAASSG